MNDEEFLSLLASVAQQVPSEQAGAAMLTLIRLRQDGVDIRRPSGLVVAVPTG